MKLLPSQKKTKIERAIIHFQEHETLEIHEPCDCGSQIRHNNGGNYHESLYLTTDEGKVYMKVESTCELAPEAEWFPCPDWSKEIEERGDWL